MERFRELERVTAGYWTHARLAGFQLLVLGGWLVASGAGHLAGAEQRLVVLSAPLAWAAAAWISLAIYPRVEPGRSRRWTAAAFWALAAVVVAFLSRAAWYRPAIPWAIALAAALACLAGVLISVHVLAWRGVETARGLLAMLAAADAARDGFEDEVLWGGVGLVLLVVGSYRLARFLWLGHRMRALRRQLKVAPSARLA